MRSREAEIARLIGDKSARGIALVAWADARRELKDFNPNQPRDSAGRWTGVGANLDPHGIAEGLVREGAKVDTEKGTVTAYHFTSPEAADAIKRSGVMKSSGDSVFFSIDPESARRGVRLRLLATHKRAIEPVAVVAKLPLSQVARSRRGRTVLELKAPGGKVDVSKLLVKD